MSTISSPVQSTPHSTSLLPNSSSLKKPSSSSFSSASTTHSTNSTLVQERNGQLVMHTTTPTKPSTLNDPLSSLPFSFMTNASSTTACHIPPLLQSPSNSHSTHLTPSSPSFKVPPFPSSSTFINKQKNLDLKENEVIQKAPEPFSSFSSDPWNPNQLRQVSLDKKERFHPSIVLNKEEDEEEETHLKSSTSLTSKLTSNRLEDSISDSDDSESNVEFMQMDEESDVAYTEEEEQVKDKKKSSFDPFSQPSSECVIFVDDTTFEENDVSNEVVHLSTTSMDPNESHSTLSSSSSIETLNERRKWPKLEARFLTESPLSDTHTPVPMGPDVEGVEPIELESSELSLKSTLSSMLHPSTPSSSTSSLPSSITSFHSYSSSNSILPSTSTSFLPSFLLHTPIPPHAIPSTITPSSTTTSYRTALSLPTNSIQSHFSSTPSFTSPISPTTPDILPYSEDFMDKTSNDSMMSEDDPFYSSSSSINTTTTTTSVSDPIPTLSSSSSSSSASLSSTFSLSSSSFPTGPTSPNMKHRDRAWRRLALHKWDDIANTRLGHPFLNLLKRSDPMYMQAIKHPMDLKKLRQYVREGKIHSTDRFHRDVYLMLANTCMFYPPDSDLHQMAKEMKVDIEKEMKAFHHVEQAAAMKLAANWTTTRLSVERQASLSTKRERDRENADEGEVKATTNEVKEVEKEEVMKEVKETRARIKLEETIHDEKEKEEGQGKRRSNLESSQSHWNSFALTSSSESIPKLASSSSSSFMTTRSKDHLAE